MQACFRTQRGYSGAGILPRHCLSGERSPPLQEEGTRKTILFNLSGHGLVDMVAYDQYFAGDLTNYAVSDVEIQKYIGSADALNVNL